MILDEADEMLDMGFLEDIEFILSQAPAERQTALFSATIPARVNALARKYLHDPVVVAIEKERMTVTLTRQTYYEVRDREKLDALTRILDFESPESVIIFCARKSDVDELGESLLGRGYAVETLHGDLSQAQRDRVMRRFRDGTAEILVATDVAARGLDIAGVSHVINYDIPWDPESYVHRIGRTGRAGRKGEAITLVTPRERRLLSIIERHINKRLNRQVCRPGGYRHAPPRAIQRLYLEDDRRGWPPDIPDHGGRTRGGEGGKRGRWTRRRLAHDPRMIAAAAFKLLEVPSSSGEPEQAPGKPPVLEVEGMGVEPGMVRLFVSAGRKQNVRPQDIVGAIANEAGVRGQDIGMIDIYDDASYVEVPKPASERVITALRGTTLRGHRVTVEIARPPDGRAPTTSTQTA